MRQPATQLIVMYEGRRCKVEVPLGCSIGDVYSHVIRAAGLLKKNEIHRRRAAQVWFGSRMLKDSQTPAADIGIVSDSVLLLVAPLGIPAPPRSCSANAFEYIRVSKGYATLGCSTCLGNVRLRDVCLRFWRCLEQSQDGHCTEGNQCPKIHLYMKPKTGRDTHSCATRASTECDSRRGNTGCSALNRQEADSYVGTPPSCQLRSASRPIPVKHTAGVEVAPTLRMQALQIPTLEPKPQDAVVPTLADLTQRQTEVPTLATLRDILESKAPGTPGTDTSYPQLPAATSRCCKVRTWSRGVDEVSNICDDPAPFNTQDTWCERSAPSRASSIHYAEDFAADHVDVTDHASTEGLSYSTPSDTNSVDASPRSNWYRYDPYNETVSRVVA